MDPSATTRGRTCCTPRCARCSDPNATQRGSLVTPARLRFDFSHDAPVTREELERIEDLVNGWIEANAPAVVEEMSHRDAIAAGALAMFGEKYGDRVRVLSFGDFSKELCGGTHARATGDIGLLKIVAETGVASGVRRIEALTGVEALQRWRAQERALERTAELLRTPVGDLESRVEKLLEERKALELELGVAALRAAQRNLGRPRLAGRDDRRHSGAAREEWTVPAATTCARWWTNCASGCAAGSCCSRRPAKIASRWRSA